MFNLFCNIVLLKEIWKTTIVKAKFLRLRNLLLLKKYIICFDKSDRFPCNGGEQWVCACSAVVSGGDGRGVKLSMAVTARVIWLCACVRYWPCTAEVVVSAEIDIIIIWPLKRKFGKIANYLSKCSQDIGAVYLLSTGFCWAGKKWSEKGSGITNRPRFCIRFGF